MLKRATRVVSRRLESIGASQKPAPGSFEGMVERRTHDGTAFVFYRYSRVCDCRTERWRNEMDEVDCQQDRLERISCLRADSTSRTESSRGWTPTVPGHKKSERQSGDHSLERGCALLATVDREFRGRVTIKFPCGQSPISSRNQDPWNAKRVQAVPKGGSRGQKPMRRKPPLSRLPNTPGREIGWLRSQRAAQVVILQAVRSWASHGRAVEICQAGIFLTGPSCCLGDEPNRYTPFESSAATLEPAPPMPIFSS